MVARVEIDAQVSIWTGLCRPSVRYGAKKEEFWIGVAEYQLLPDPRVALGASPIVVVKASDYIRVTGKASGRPPRTPCAGQNTSMNLCHGILCFDSLDKWIPNSICLSLDLTVS